MDSNFDASSFKLAKKISKGNKAWKKVNKLANKLKNRGVPSSIVDIIDGSEKINPRFINGIYFEQRVPIEQMVALAKIQSI